MFLCLGLPQLGGLCAASSIGTDRGEPQRSHDQAGAEAHSRVSPVEAVGCRGAGRRHVCDEGIGLRPVTPQIHLVGSP